MKLQTLIFWVTLTASYVLELEAITVWPPKYWIKKKRPWRYDTGCGWEMKKHHWERRSCSWDAPSLHPSDLLQGEAGFIYFCNQYGSFFVTDEIGYPHNARYSHMYRQMYAHHNTPWFLLSGPGYPRNFVVDRQYQWSRWKWERYDCHLEYQDDDEFDHRCFHQLCLTLWFPGRLGPAHLSVPYVEATYALGADLISDILNEVYESFEYTDWLELNEFVLVNMTLPNIGGRHVRCRKIRRPVREKIMCYSSNFVHGFQAYQTPKGMTRWTFLEEVAQVLWDAALTNFTALPYSNFSAGLPYGELFRGMRGIETELRTRKAFALYRHVPVSDPARLSHWQQAFLRPMRSFEPEGWLKQNPNNLSECVTLDMGHTVFCVAGFGQVPELGRMTLYQVLNFVHELIITRDKRLTQHNGACHDPDTAEFYNVLTCKDDDVEYRVTELDWNGRRRIARRSVRFLIDNAFDLRCPSKYWYPNPYSNCWEGEFGKYYQHIYHIPVDLL